MKGKPTKAHVSRKAAEARKADRCHDSIVARRKQQLKPADVNPKLDPTEEPVRIHKDGREDHWVEYRIKDIGRYQITRYEHQVEGLKAGSSVCSVATFENINQAHTAKLAFEMYERCRRQPHSGEQEYLITSGERLGDPEGLIFWAYGEKDVNDKLISLGEQYPTREWHVSARVNKSRNGLIE